MGRMGCESLFSHRSLGMSTSQHVACAVLVLPNCLATSRNKLDVEGKYMSLIASFMNLAGPDVIVILLIILVLFRAKKLPELARGMGQAVKEFQKAKDEFNDELHKAGKSDTQVAKPDVKPAESTIARTDSQGASNVTAPQPSATVTPGDKADQV